MTDIESTPIRPGPVDPALAAAQRRGVRRTAMLLAGVALGLFAWTIWSLVHGR